MDKVKCDYCTEDFDGYYRPLDKNGHLCVFDTPHEKYINVDWYGHKMKIDINYFEIAKERIEKS